MKALTTLSEKFNEHDLINSIQLRHELYTDLLTNITAILQIENVCYNRGLFMQAGLCKLILDRYDLCVYYDNKCSKILPELFNKNPNKISKLAYWFPCNEKGWELRMAILKECINETA